MKRPNEADGMEKEWAVSALWRGMHRGSVVDLGQSDPEIGSDGEVVRQSTNCCRYRPAKRSGASLPRGAGECKWMTRRLEKLKCCFFHADPEPQSREGRKSAYRRGNVVPLECFGAQWSGQGEL